MLHGQILDAIKGLFSFGTKKAEALDGSETMLLEQKSTIRSVGVKDLVAYINSFDTPVETAPILITISNGLPYTIPDDGLSYNIVCVNSGTITLPTASPLSKRIINIANRTGTTMVVQVKDLVNEVMSSDFSYQASTTNVVTNNGGIYQFRLLATTRWFYESSLDSNIVNTNNNQNVGGLKTFTTGIATDTINESLSGKIAFKIAGVEAWEVSGANNLIPGADDLYDLGAQLTRLRNAFIAGEVFAGAFVATIDTVQSGTFSISGNTQITPVDTSSASVTANLHQASGLPKGYPVIIKDINKNAGANNITIVPNGTDTIDGVNAAITISNNGGSVHLVSDGTSNWIILYKF